MVAKAAVVDNASACPQPSTRRDAERRGYDHLPTAGAVRNAVYLNPRVVYSIDSRAALYGGYLYATAEEYVADAFRSGLNGGQPVGPRARCLVALGPYARSRLGLALCLPATADTAAEDAPLLTRTSVADAGTPAGATSSLLLLERPRGRGEAPSLPSVEPALELRAYMIPADLLAAQTRR